MKNTFGNSITLTLFGESHGGCIGAVIDGICPGIKLDYGFIDRQLSRRRPYGKISTARVEDDSYEIVSGVFNCHTTGAPLTIIIKNKDIDSTVYGSDYGIIRPSHADYTAYLKYHGYHDYRGGGHFSGRLTAVIVAAGAIIIQALKRKKIFIGTHISRCRSISDRQFESFQSDIEQLEGSTFPVLDVAAGEKIKAEIEKAADDKDSVGGILETAIDGIDIGLGEPWFDSVESVISKGVFAIPAVKGVEFGAGFGIADMYGSEANDNLYISDNEIKTKTNNSGGINGGITNGMPIIFRTAIKPTPSIGKTMQTVDFVTGVELPLTLQGRHDPAIFHRAAVVIDSITAFAIADLLALRYGTDYLAYEDRF